MGDNIVVRHIRRCNRNLLLINLALLAVVVLVACLNSRLVTNVFRGAATLDRDAVLAIEDPAKMDLYYVNVSADDVLDTGYYRLSKTVNEDTGAVTEQKTTAYYLALVFDDRLLLVSAPKATLAPESVAGTLVPIPSNVQEKVLDELVAEYPQLEGAFLPALLQVRDLRLDSIAVFVIGAILAAFALWNLVRVALRTSDPSRHPIMKTLSRYGSSDQIAWQIDSEAISAGEYPGSGRTLVTNSWLLHPTFFGAKVVPLADLYWAYGKVVTRRSYGIAVGKNYSTLLVRRSGKPVELGGTEARSDALVKAIHSRAPWIFVGYNDALVAAWRKDSGAVIAEVDRRRALQGALADTDPPSYSSASPEEPEAM